MTEVWGTISAMGAVILTMLAMLVKISYSQGQRDTELRMLRKEHDELEIYTHKIRHETVSALNGDLSKIKLYLVRHVGNGINEL